MPCNATALVFLESEVPLHVTHSFISTLPPLVPFVKDKGIQLSWKVFQIPGVSVEGLCGACTILLCLCQGEGRDLHVGASQQQHVFHFLL